jgi:hypothetical protein
MWFLVQIKTIYGRNERSAISISIMSMHFLNPGKRR